MRQKPSENQGIWTNFLKKYPDKIRQIRNFDCFFKKMCYNIPIFIVYH